MEFRSILGACLLLVALSVLTAASEFGPTRPIADAVVIDTKAALPAGAESAAEPVAELQWQTYSDELFPPPRSAPRPAVITFGATWCAPCLEMKERTFRDPEVLRAGEGALFLHVDMTEEDRYIRSVRQRFAVSGAPTTIFFGASAAERSRQIGFIPPDVFARHLRESAGPPPERPKSAASPPRPRE